MGLHECGLLFKNRLSKNSKELQQIMDKPWLADHIKNGHGPLCAAYPQEYTSEGDTPSFMPLIRNGLEQHTDYTLGGWGGRPEYKNGNHMQDGNDLKTVCRIRIILSSVGCLLYKMTGRLVPTGAWLMNIQRQIINLLPGYWEKVYAQSGREKNNTGCLSFI